MGSGGQLLVDSLDVRATDALQNCAYHEANRRAGRYVGEVRMQLVFGDHEAPYRGWLHVDPQTLTERAAHAGWTCAIVRRDPGGDYLARLTRHDAAAMRRSEPDPAPEQEQTPDRT